MWLKWRFAFLLAGALQRGGEGVIKCESGCNRTLQTVLCANPVMCSVQTMLCALCKLCSMLFVNRALCKLCSAPSTRTNHHLGFPGVYRGVLAQYVLVFTMVISGDLVALDSFI